MKILHCCLAAFYIDNFGYQENILPKMHKLQGHDVEIVASTENYIDNKYLGYVKPSVYKNIDDIIVHRIPYTKYLPFLLVKKLRIYKGLSQKLKEIKPDIVFLHDLQFFSVARVAFYLKKNKNVSLFVDGHTDFINSGKNWISKYLLHGLLYKICAKIISPYVTRFYGTLPLRVSFFENVYGIPKSKIDLLMFGVDDTLFNLNNSESIKRRIRSELFLKDDDFVVITGGKIDKRKNIHILLNSLLKVDNNKLKLIIFGTPTDEMEEIIGHLLKSDRVINLGWVSPLKINDYLIASDLGFFPGTHSVIWEQAIGTGLPCIFKKWNGIEHVDIGGNCILMDEISEETITNTIINIMEGPGIVSRMKEISMTKGVEIFSYSKIAERSLMLNQNSRVIGDE